MKIQVNSVAHATSVLRDEGKTPRSSRRIHEEWEARASNDSRVLKGQGPLLESELRKGFQAGGGRHPHYLQGGRGNLSEAYCSGDEGSTGRFLSLFTRWLLGMDGGSVGPGL